MTKVKRSNDCGNSPKNQFIEEMEIAFAQGNREFLANAVTPDIHWTIVGQKNAHGIDEFLALLRETVQRAEVLESAIHHVVTHGKAGAVNGVRQYHDGKTYDFCTMYEFANAKGATIREVIHYAIVRKQRLLWLRWGWRAAQRRSSIPTRRGRCPHCGCGEKGAATRCTRRKFYVTGTKQGPRLWLHERSAEQRKHDCI